MSTWKVSLSILGAVVLALIVAYNAWTTRRHTPRRAQDEAHGGRPPPGFAATPPAAPLGAPAADAEAARQWPVPALPPERRYGLDPLTDVIAPLQPEHPVSGAAALAALPPTRRAGSKPFAIE